MLTMFLQFRFLYDFPRQPNMDFCSAPIGLWMDGWCVDRLPFLSRQAHRSFFHGSAASRSHLPAGESVLPTMTLSASCKVSWAHPQDEGKGFCAAKRLCGVARSSKRASGTSKASCLSGQRQHGCSLYSPVGGIEPLQGALRAGLCVRDATLLPAPLLVSPTWRDFPYKSVTSLRIVIQNNLH